MYVCDPTTHVEQYPHSFGFEAWSNVLISTMGFLIRSVFIDFANLHVPFYLSSPRPTLMSFNWRW